MNPHQILQAVYDRLIDERGEDPRSALLHNLRRLIDAGDDMPSGQIELTAVVRPGGVFEVHDQHGRPVAGVKSVAVFHDQAGQPVFQVNL